MKIQSGTEKCRLGNEKCQTDAKKCRLGTEKCQGTSKNQLGNVKEAMTLSVFCMNSTVSWLSVADFIKIRLEVIRTCQKLT